MPAQSKLKKDCISGVIWTLVFAAILLLSRGLNERVRTYPTIITAVGLTLSVLFLIITAVKLAREGKTEAPPAEAPDAVQKKEARKVFLKRKVLPWVLLITFILCFRYIGFTIACFLFVLCFFCYMAMGYLASREGSSALMNWVEQGVNTLGQILLLAGVWSLHKAGLREFRL